jgi:CBS domain-containing protein
MKTLDMYRVSDSSTMHDAISVIQRNESRCAVVCRPDGKVIGVFSEGDVMRALLDGVQVRAPLRNLMRPSFTFFTSRDLEAARPLFLDGMTLIPVVDQDFRLTSVITLQDVFGDRA